MSAMASQLTSLTFGYSTVYSGADQRKHHSTASLAFMRGIHRWAGNSPHKWNGQQRGKCFHLMTASWVIQKIWVKSFSTWLQQQNRTNHEQCAYSFACIANCVNGIPSVTLILNHKSCLLKHLDCQQYIKLKHENLIVLPGRLNVYHLFPSYVMV